MRTLAALLFGIFYLAAILSPAAGATAIYYSKPDATYGWCAGYSYSRSESCARNECVDAGGGACELAIECDGGWGAVAFADGSVKGAGAACNANIANGARIAALLACLAANRTRCSTSDTFNSRGSQAATRANEEFDLALYTQLLLSISGYEPGTVDGEMGSKTRTAIRTFQADMGLEQTGEADRNLLRLLTYAAHGTGALSDAAEAHLRNDAGMNDHSVGLSTLAPQRQSFSDELRAKSDAERGSAMAVVLRLAHYACTLPATSATLIGGKTGPDAWDVQCAEGNYLVNLSGNRTIVTAH